MLAGHLAVALASKKADPELPLPAAVGAAFALDLVWPVLLLVGLESVSVSPGDTAFTNLSFDAYPWTHSLLMVAGWSLLALAVGRATLGSWKSGTVVGVLVFSHWILDLVTHRPDLPLWPGGPLVGLGLWNSVVATLLVEGALLCIGLVLYLDATSPKNASGRWRLVSLVAFIGLIWATQPWAPPPPSATAVALGALALWLVIPWAGWIERQRRPRPMP